MFKRSITYLSSHRRLAALYTGCFLASALLMSLVFKVALPLEVKHDTAPQQSNGHRIDAPLALTLNQAVHRVDAATIKPWVQGEWQEQRVLTGVNKLTFYPKEDFTPGQTYTVTLHMQRLAVGSAETETLQFTTEKAPSLVSFSAIDQGVLAANGATEATFSGSVKKLRDLTLKAGDITLERTISADGKRVSWRVKELLPQGKKTKLVLTDTKTGETLVEREIDVAPQPTIATPVTAVNFGKSDTATIVFSEAIDQKSLSDDMVTFSLDGQGMWRDDKTYVFTPDTVSPGKTYKYTVKAGIQTKRGGVLLKDQTKTFSTPGHVGAYITPRGGEVRQASQEVRVTFNQPVIHKSAEQRLKISRGAIGAIRWQGSTMIIPVSKMGYQQSVTVTVAAGVEPVFGIRNTNTLSHTFTTEAQTIKLNVPFYYQQFAQSCEAASVRMALAYRGTSASDWQILQKFGYAPRSLDTKNNVWDDPQKQFVGDVKGNQGKGTGWGVYAEPVAAAVRSYGREATVRYGVSAAFVAGQIHQKRPVVLWGIWDDSAVQKTWKTPDGKKVSGPIPMHVRLVVGVKGSPSNPIGFYVNDPITGPAYWTASYLQYNVNRAGGANQAVSIH